MNWLARWMVRRNLRRGEKALAAEDAHRAFIAFEGAWEKLAATQSNVPDEFIVDSLSGIDKAARLLGESTKLLSPARAARRRFPQCREVIPLLGACVAQHCDPLDERGCEDLVAWTTASSISVSPSESRQLEQRLSEFLHPESEFCRGNAQAAREFLDRLREGSSWQWPTLYAAELCRQERQWVEAGELLLAAIEQTPQSPNAPTWHWKASNCFALAGQWQRALASVQIAHQSGMPKAPENIAVLVAILTRAGNSQQAIRAAIVGAMTTNQSEQFLHWIDFLVQSIDDQETLRQSFCTLLDELTEPGSRAHAAQIVFRTAVRLRDRDLLAIVEDRLGQLGGAFPESVQLACVASGIADGTISPADVQDTLDHFEGPEARELGQIAREWLEAESLGNAHSATRKTTPSRSDLPNWRRLKRRIEGRQLVDAGLVGAAVAWISNDDRSDEEARDWMIAASLDLAVRKNDWDAVLGLVRNCRQSGLRRVVAMNLVAHAAEFWNRSPSAQTAHTVLPWLESARELGEKLCGHSLLWLGCLSQLTGRPAHPKIGAIAKGDARLRFGPLACFLRKSAGQDAWCDFEDHELAAIREKPLGEWMLRVRAREHLLADNLARAGSALSLPDATTRSALNRIGGAQACANQLDAWDAYVAGRWQDCFEKSCECLEAGDTAPVIPLLAVMAIDHLAAMHAEETSPGATSHLKQRLRSIVSSRGRQLPWVVSAKLGLLDRARNSLEERLLQEQRPTPLLLHAWMLVSLSKIQQVNSESKELNRLQGVSECIGLGATMLAQPLLLRRFASTRYLEYGHGQNVPTAERITTQLAIAITALLHERTDEMGLTRQDVGLAFELERVAAEHVSNTNGHSNGGEFPAGPMLAATLGRAESLQTRLDRARRTPGDAAEIGRLFSPLGPTTILLRRGQFSQTIAKLNQLSSETQSGPLDAVLWKYVPSAEARRWLNQERDTLRLECRLEEARELVGQVPIDVPGLRATFAELAKEQRGGAAVQRFVEICVGRAKTLLTTRNKQERLADSTDRRSNSARRQEAKELLQGAWDVTKHADVQGPLTNILNQDAVEAANEDRYDESISQLKASLAIKSNSKIVADNLANVALKRMDVELEAPTRALKRLEAEIEHLERSNRSWQSTEVSAALKMMRDHRHVPFSNRAAKAANEEDLDQATEWMVRAFSVLPQDQSLIETAKQLAAKLRSDVEEGVPRAERCLERLIEAAPPNTLDEPAPEVQLRRLMAEALGMTDEIQQLNELAVAAARSERFEEAVRLLMLARVQAPRADVVRENGRNISMAWADHCMSRGDTPGFMRAMQAYGVFDE